MPEDKKPEKFDEAIMLQNGVRIDLLEPIQELVKRESIGELDDVSRELFNRSPRADDPGYCGLEPFTTGPWDPYLPNACTPHDQDMQSQKDGKLLRSPFNTAGRFIKNSAIVAAKGLYAVVAFPVYVIIGAIGGLILGNSRLTKEDVEKLHPDGE